MLVRGDQVVSPGPAKGGNGGWSRSATVALVVGALALGAGGLAAGVAVLVGAPAGGPRGAAGATGLRGARGSRGAQGVQGLVGPQGATGAQGKTGAAGPAGPQGQTGPQGPAGPAGTIAGSSVVEQRLRTTAADPTVGATLAATVNCPAGDVLLGGGGEVGTAKGGSPRPVSSGSAAGGPVSSGSAAGGFSARGAGDVALEASYPAAGGWRTVAVVSSALSGGEMMTLRPYALCGKK